MKRTTAKPESLHRCAAFVAAGCGLILLLLAVHVGKADAALEQVKVFGSEGAQLRLPTGTAVNTTGAGGVPVGTVYAVAENSPSIARFTPQGELRAIWGWGVGEKGKQEYQRCGPDGEAAYPTCAVPPLTSGVPTEGLGSGGEGLGQLSRPTGIAVDQATGNVYVFNQGRKFHSVQVFSADGSQQLGGFGELGSPENFPKPAESIEEGPSKFHVTSIYGAALTVDESGRVYVPDADYAGAVPPLHTRVMVFEPETPGNYEHYVYAGRGHDLDNLPVGGPIASDNAGHIYPSQNNQIYKVAPPSSTPICKFDLPTGGITSIAVDPESEDVYYLNQKKRNIHRLVCNSEGVFVDVETIEPAPKEELYTALAFNPATAFEDTRPQGILYAVLPAESTGGGVHVFAPAAVLHPLIESLDATDVGISSASLHAVVNPKGAPTTYVFQYISDADYQANSQSERFVGADELPSGGGQLQSGLAGVTVAAVLPGLESGTQYHFRVVAENCTEGEDPSLCTSVSPEETFRTFPAGSGSVPDHRVYELVSPAQKNGGQVYPPATINFTPSCIECKPGIVGTKYPAFSAPSGDRVAYEGDPFSFTEGAPNDDGYLAERTGNGWQTTTLNPTLGGSGSGQGLVGYDGNLTKGVLYQGKPSLTPTAPSEVPNLYTLPSASPAALSPLLSQEPPNRGGLVNLVYAGGSDDLAHIFFAADDALTGGTAVAPPAEFQFNLNNLYEYYEGQLRLVNVLPGNTETVVGATFGREPSPGTNEKTDLSHAISADGTRVFWSDPSGQVYVREDGVSTHELSDHAGQFLTANASGTKVLLTDGNLIDLANGDESVELPQGQGGFLGIAGQSEDLSRIYFVDTAVLDGTPNSQGDSAEAGRNNLYLWNEGATRFIATLSGKGKVDDNRNWAKAPVQRSAAASPDGDWLAFTSSANLTGGNSEGLCGGNGPEFAPGPCTEVFLYDAAKGQLLCPSCSPTEEGTVGFSHLASLFNAPAALPQQRFITNAGRLFFDSPNRLSPRDTNDGAEDVYEYEPEGIGTCEEAGGCIRLVSAGDEFTDSNLLFIDPSGKNAFFTTREQLSLRDRDELFDLYDAREGGGIPGETEPLHSECQGEACQPPISVPNDPTPGSSTFEGAGNVVEKANKKHRKHHHKKHRKHHKKKQKSKHKRGGVTRANHNRGGAK